MLIFSEIQLLREVVVEGLRAAFISSNVEGVASLAEARERVAANAPGLVLIDAMLTYGFNAASTLRQLSTTTALIVFNASDEEIQGAAWSAVGVIAYAGRSCTLNEIVNVVGPFVSRPVIMDHSGLPAFRGKPGIIAKQPEDGTVLGATLTAREEEVVRLIIAGESNKEIARSLNISLATVKSHVHNALTKFGLQRRGKLALQYSADRPSAGNALSAPRLITVATEMYRGAAEPLHSVNSV